MKKYDVTIIGGGPIGGAAAQIFSTKGYNVSIFEKKDKIGEPVNCAGLVSHRVLELCNINKNTIVQNKIKGANIHSPSGNILQIGGNKNHAYVINRKLFDQKIIDSAEDKGAKIFLKNKLIKAKNIDSNVEFTTSKKQKYKCSLLIGADGPNSTVRNIFSFQKPKEILKGIGAEIENTNLNPDYVEIFIGNNIAPGFFAWIIPTNRSGSKARIGLCGKEKSQFPISHYFNSFLKNKYLSNYFKNIKIASRLGGLIPIGPIKPFVKSNIILIGDAAAQVKPTSGGGLYPGLMCAKKLQAS